MNVTAVVIFVATISGSVQLDYECYFDGSIDIRNPDQTKFKFFEIALGHDNTECHGNFTADYSHVLFKDCGLGKYMSITFFKRKFGIIMAGNYAGPFRVQCHDIPPAETLATIISHYFIRNNVTVPATLKESINGSMIVTKMRHISQSSVFYDDFSFEWVLNITVLQHLLGLEYASGSTTLTPSETIPPGPTIGSIAYSTALKYIAKALYNVTTSSSVGQSSNISIDMPFVKSLSTGSSLFNESNSSMDSTPIHSPIVTRSISTSTPSSTDNLVSPVSSTNIQSTTGDETSSAVTNFTASMIGNNTSMTSSTTTRLQVADDTSTA